jgi:hypothetical protein
MPQHIERNLQGKRHAQRTATQQPRKEKTEEAARAGRTADPGLSANSLEEVTEGKIGV